MSIQKEIGETKIQTPESEMTKNLSYHVKNPPDVKFNQLPGQNFFFTKMKFHQRPGEKKNWNWRPCIWIGNVKIWILKCDKTLCTRAGSDKQKWNWRPCILMRHVKIRILKFDKTLCELFFSTGIWFAKFHFQPLYLEGDLDLTGKCHQKNWHKVKIYKKRSLQLVS